MTRLEKKNIFTKLLNSLGIKYYIDVDLITLHHQHFVSVEQVKDERCRSRPGPGSCEAAHCRLLLARGRCIDTPDLTRWSSPERNKRPQVCLPWARYRTRYQNLLPSHQFWVYAATTTCKQLFLSIPDFLDLSTIVSPVYLCLLCATVSFSSADLGQFLIVQVWAEFLAQPRLWRGLPANMSEYSSSTWLCRTDYCPGSWR